MEQKKQRALSAIEERREQLCGLSDALWEHPEVGFHENFAAQAFCRALEQEGFRVERDLAGIKTAFSGTFGEGGPVIGFLGEFDALPGLSRRQAQRSRRRSRREPRATAADTTCWAWAQWRRPLG